MANKIESTQATGSVPKWGPRLQYSETWSEADSPSRFQYTVSGKNEVAAHKVIRSGRDYGWITRDPFDDWFEARTPKGKYIGTFETQREAVEALAEWMVL